MSSPESAPDDIEFIDVVGYDEERQPDSQYRDVLERIYVDGEEVVPIHGEMARRIIGPQLRYKMANGFPAITERDFSKMFNSAIAEHVAFLNGARTQEELEKFGCKWWERWVTPEKCAIFGLEPGDLGDGSYGAAWTKFPTADGGSFDQIEHVVRQIVEMPYLRSHFISPWIPEYTIQHSELQRKVVVAPCHGWIHVLTNPQEKTLSIHHYQRSGDFPVGVPFNLVQYAAFGLMIAKDMDYRLDEIVYTFSDAHIYESQFPAVEEMLNREPKALGKVAISGSFENVKDYRPKNFRLTDYESHSGMKIPTPI